MKKYFVKSVSLALALVSLILGLTACGKKVLSLTPAYRGEEVTELDHEFKKEDFYVYATFTDGTDGEVTDFEMKVKGMDAGYYILEFTYNGFTEEGYVKCNLPIYPSDKENADQTGE